MLDKMLTHGLLSDYTQLFAILCGRMSVSNKYNHHVNSQGVMSLSSETLRNPGTQEETHLLASGHDSTWDQGGRSNISMEECRKIGLPAVFVGFPLKIQYYTGLHLLHFCFGRQRTIMQASISFQMLFHTNCSFPYTSSLL